MQPNAAQKKSITREPEREECVVCTEAFDASKRRKVACPFCPSDAPSACRGCAQTYLLGAVQDAHCMSCKHDWSLGFCHEALTKSWFVGPYRKSRQEKAVEREHGRMVEAMPLLEARQRQKRRAEEQRVIITQIQELKMRLYRLRCGEHDDGDAAALAAAATASANKTRYLRTCPVDGCRGMVEANSWKCGVCESVLCSSCHAVKRDKDTPAAEAPKHVCKPDDVATAKHIMSSTRPCPQCSARIFKIEGCDQMFCVQCHTPFSWATGKVVTGTIHNPHYYELQRKLGRGAAPRAIGDVPCGGLLDWAHVDPVLNGHPADRVKEIHRLAGEVRDHLQQHLLQRDTIDIRLAFLAQEIDADGLKRRLFLRQRQNDKAREVRNVLETFLTTVVERLRHLVTSCGDLKGSSAKRRAERERLIKELVTEVAQVVDFCNEAMETTLKAMGFSAGPVLRLGRRFKASERLGRHRSSAAAFDEAIAVAGDSREDEEEPPRGNYDSDEEDE
jgi:hypothetical protein